MDTFFATPISTTYTPLSPASTIYQNGIYRPIVPNNQFYTNSIITSSGIPNVYRVANGLYYDSGIGENPVARHEINADLRYLFLDKWLYDEYPEILRMLKVEGNTCKVLSAADAKNNDISKDSESDLITKSNFIGHEILTLKKNGKILDTICRKNNIKYYNLHDNKYFVRKAQSKYVLSKLMKK